MQVKKLTLTHVRAFEQAEFHFQPGMNLLVGINGAGKSTVLDALRIMLSQALPEFTAASRRGHIPFSETDITVGRGALTAQLYFEAAGIEFEHLIHLPREEYDLYERHALSPSGKELPKKLQKHAEQPLAIYFSPHRSLLSTKTSSVGGQAAAFVNALADDRGLRLREFAEWWLVQETLASEVGNGSSKTRYLTVLNDAITSFLDGCTKLRAVDEPETTLLIDKEDSTLDVRQLSDGERSMIALVLDVARRLAQANPKLSDPLREGKGVVLIDELDLHLHPRWQRTIAEKLTATFPNCQFIATTHSPQIIGELSPDQIILIEKGKTDRPYQSLGMDTNWILRHLMKVTERDADTLQALKKIEELIEEEQYDDATAAIDVLRTKLGEFPDLVNLQTRIDFIDFLSDEEEEESL